MENYNFKSGLKQTNDKKKVLGLECKLIVNKTKKSFFHH